MNEEGSDFFRESSDEVLIEYFCDTPWGQVIDDDKYWEEELLMDRFIIFYVHAFAWLNLPRPSRSQLMMAMHLSDTSNPHRMLMAMRGLSKSLTSQIYVVWRLVNNPDEKILVMSAGATRAVNYTSFVQKLIYLLPISRGMKPRHNMERTSGQSFDVVGAAPSDSPSVYAVGAGNQVTGMRATLVIYDDIETAQTVESAALTEKIDKYAMEAQNLLMSGHDESIALCTPHSMASIYIKWIEEKGYKPLVIPAEYPDPANNDNYFGGLAPYIIDAVQKDESLIGQAVDERIDKAHLLSKLRLVGRSTYKLQYMLDVTESDDIKHPLKLSDLIVMDIDEDTAPLKINYSSMRENEIKIKHNGFSKDKLYTPGWHSNEYAEYEDRVMAIDPSGRGKDKTGIVIAYSLNTRIFLKNAVGMEGGYDDNIMEQIAKLAAQHRITTILIEKNFGDGAFKKMLEPYIALHCKDVAIEEVNAVGQKEQRIIRTMEPLLNQHRIVVDKAFLEKDNDKQILHSWTHQLAKITKERGCLKHDDVIDCSEIVCSYLMEKLPMDDSFGIDRYIEEELAEIAALNNEIFEGWYPEGKKFNY